MPSAAHAHVNWKSQKYPDNLNSQIDPTAIIKGDNDWRTYEHIHCQNGISIMLVSDKNAAKAAASCCVDVGASSDPRDFPGECACCT
jgi:secreted Zn-dependent insulinase-like peptidase